MFGEWCADWYDENYYQHSPESNPKGPTQGSLRLLRGASWADYPSNLRCAYRSRDNPNYRGIGGGFRCAQDVLF